MSENDDYKSAIFLMVNKIKDNDILKRIYDVVLYLYKKSN